MSVCVTVSHFSLVLGTRLAAIPLTTFPSKLYRYPEPIVAYSDPMPKLPSIPTCPQLARNFRLSTTGNPCINVSSDTLHPAENDGNTPYLLLVVKTEDPSRLRFAVSKYLSAKE